MTELASAAKAGSTRMTVLGVIAIVLGILCMLAPGLTGISVAILVGMLVLAGGIVRMIWAFQAGGFLKGLLKFVIGVLTLLCGIALVSNPLLASGFLTILLTIYLIDDGIFDLSAGARLKSQAGSGWLIFGGIVSILLGLMIWRQFPLSGPWAIGILLGIKLFFVGLTMVTAAPAARSMPAE